MEKTVPAKIIFQLWSVKLRKDFSVVWSCNNFSLQINPNSWGVQAVGLQFSPVSCGSMPLKNGVCQQDVGRSENAPSHCFFLQSLISFSWDVSAACVSGRCGEGIFSELLMEIPEQSVLVLFTMAGNLEEKQQFQIFPLAERSKEGLMFFRYSKGFMY